jgi:5-methyltetrahydrofolate--homocysteine methyltransferase
MVNLNNISEALQSGRAEKVHELVKQALNEDIIPKKILEEGLIRGMSIIGEKFKKNEVYVPEVLIAARAMHAGMEVLKPNTMVNMPEVIKALEVAGLRDKVKVMVGGAPITQNYADQIGADGYSPDATSTTDKAKTFLN